MHVEEQDKLDKKNALDLIDISDKREKMKIVRRYTSHYLLGLKVCCGGCQYSRPYVTCPPGIQMPNSILKINEFMVFS